MSRRKNRSPERIIGMLREAGVRARYLKLQVALE